MALLFHLLDLIAGLFFCFPAGSFFFDGLFLIAGLWPWYFSAGLGSVLLDVFFFVSIAGLGLA